VNALQQPIWRPFTVLQARDPDELNAIYSKRFPEFFDITREAVPFLVDSTAGFTREGAMLGLASRMVPILYRGITASWIRVRIVSGGEPLPPGVAGDLE